MDQEAERRKTQSKMRTIVETQRTKLEENNAAGSQLDVDYAKVIQQGEEVKKDVQRSIDNLKAAIEAKKQNMFAAVDSQTRKSIETLRKREIEIEIEQQKKAIKSTLEKADKLLTQSANAEIDQLKKSLEMLCFYEKINQTEQIDRDPKGIPILAFVENHNILDTVNTEGIGSLEVTVNPTLASESVAEGKGLTEAFTGGEAQFVLMTRDAEGKLCYNNVDQVTLDIRDEQRRECATKVQINDNKDGSYKISYSPREQGNCKITVRVNGEQIRNSPFAVQVKLLQFKHVLSFGQKGSSVGMFQHPWGVAVNARDEIAVTDSFNGRVQIFSSDGDYLRSFGQFGSKEGEFGCSGPTGIMFHNNGNIFVADKSRGIQIFSWEGKYLGQFGEQGSLDCRLSNPRGLSVDSDGNIIVADTDNKLIKIFSPNGEFLMKIGEQEIFPWHCIQCDSYLVVSDAAGHCIKVFDREGNFQYKFGKQGGGNGEFKCPRSLSVDKSGHLLVCDEGNYRMQVFELNGKFLGKFGTPGSKLGEFDRPRSVAVLSNGRIVVCDYYNHRIQIFSS